jgi:hypothetical protein
LPQKGRFAGSAVVVVLGAQVGVGRAGTSVGLRTGMRVGEGLVDEVAEVEVEVMGDDIVLVV